MNQPATRNREEFLEARRKGIGGSDAPSILGFGRHSPLELFGIKTGVIEEDDLSKLEFVHFGNVLEGVIAEEYERRTGRVVTRVTEQYQSEAHPFMLCHPDGIIESSDNPDPGVLEIKTASAWLAAKWEDEPPLAYQVQLQHNLITTGRDWGSLACLIGGNQFRWMDFELNERFGKVLIEREAEFWGYVERCEPPPLSQIEGDARALAALYPSVKDLETVALPPEAFEWDAQRLEAVDEIKKHQAIKKEAENQLKAALGEHAVGFMTDGISYSWNEQTRKSYTVAEATYRVLRRHKAKGGAR